ncbi:hypothetical protein ES705_31541 [subsurface metagenome]
MDFIACPFTPRLLPAPTPSTPPSTPPPLPTPRVGAGSTPLAGSTPPTRLVTKGHALFS